MKKYMKGISVIILVLAVAGCGSNAGREKKGEVGLVSFIFKGIAYYENSAYPNNLVKTLNIDLNTGKNVRLKEFSDIAFVVSCLELADGVFCNQRKSLGSFYEGRTCDGGLRGIGILQKSVEIKIKKGISQSMWNI